MADGSVVLAVARARCPGVGRPTAVGRHADPGGRARRPGPGPTAGPGGGARPRRRGRLRVQPVPAELREPHLGTAPAVGGARVGARAHDARGRGRWVAGAGRCRSRRGDGRRGERHRTRARRSRPAALDRRCGGRPSRSRSCDGGGGRATLGVLHGHVALVDRRPHRRGPVRGRRAPLLGDGRRGVGHVVGPRGRARPRLLAVLRLGGRRTVERRVNGLSRQSRTPAPRGHARRGGARRALVHAMAGPTLACRPAVRRRGRGDRRASAGRCVRLRPALVGRPRPDHSRARAAQLDPRGAARGAEPQPRARRARRRHGGPVAQVGPSHRRARRRRQHGQPAGVGDRRVRRRPAATTRRPGVVAAGGGRARSTRRREGARAAGSGVRRLPLGHHHRPDPAWSHGATAAHARSAAARGRPAHEPAVRPRPALPGRHRRTGVGRAGGQAPRCPRCRRPPRRELGALRHTAGGSHLGGTRRRSGARPAGRVRAGADAVGHAPRPRARPRDGDRGARVGRRPRCHCARHRGCRGGRAGVRSDTARRRR